MKLLDKIFKKNSKNDGKKHLFFHRFTISSIESQAIRNFLLLTGSLLFIMWIFELVFFNLFYEGVRLRDFKRDGDNIVKICYTEGYENKLYSFSRLTNIGIMLVEVESSGTFTVKFSTTAVPDLATHIEKFQSAKEKLNDVDNVIYEDTDYNLLVYIKRVDITDGTTRYLYAELPYTPATSTDEVFIIMLTFVSVIGFIIAAFFSYFLSKNISTPITNISKKAKEFTNGNLDVTFDSRDYYEVEQLSTSLNYAVDEIKKSQRLQQEVIANISHELKTPLTMIRSYAELINDISGDDKEKREKHLQIILEEADRLDYLINDIMQYSKLNCNLIEYNKTYFNLVDLIVRYEEFYREKFSSEGFDFEFKYPDDEVMIYADQKRIEQVFINLMNNAINYSQEKKKIRVELARLTNYARLVVRDYGMGIEKEDLEKIFEKHFRSVGGRRCRVGRGIGLSICKSILDYHGFNFNVKSEVNKGSIFYIDFPLVHEEEELTFSIDKNNDADNFSFNDNMVIRNDIVAETNEKKDENAETKDNLVDDFNA